GGQRAAEGVTRLGDARARHARRALVEQLGAGGGETRRAAIDDADGARVRRAADFLPRNADGEIAEAVAVEVAGGERAAEAVAGLGRAAELALVPELVVVVGQARRAAVQDVDRAGVEDRPDVLARHTDREIGEAVVVEVAGDGGGAEAIAAGR